MYLRNSSFLYDNSFERTLGRGMISVNMVSLEDIMNVAEFVRFYQNNTKLLIGSLEEIAFRKGIIDKEQLEKIACSTKCFILLKPLL